MGFWDDIIDPNKAAVAVKPVQQQSSIQVVQAKPAGSITVNHNAPAQPGDANFVGPLTPGETKAKATPKKTTVAVNPAQPFKTVQESQPEALQPTVQNTNSDNFWDGIVAPDQLKTVSQGGASKQSISVPKVAAAGPLTPAEQKAQDAQNAPLKVAPKSGPNPFDETVSPDANNFNAGSAQPVAPNSFWEGIANPDQLSVTNVDRQPTPAAVPTITPAQTAKQKQVIDNETAQEPLWHQIADKIVNNPASYFVNGLSDASTTLVQGMMRSVASIPVSLQNFITGEDTHLTPEQGTKLGSVESVLFGNKPVGGFIQSGQEQLQGFGANKASNNKFLAGGVGAVGAALNFIGAGEEENVLAKALAAESDASKVMQILSKAGVDAELIPKLAPGLAELSDVNKIKQVLQNTDDLMGAKAAVQAAQTEAAGSDAARAVPAGIDSAQPTIKEGQFINQNLKNSSIVSQEIKDNLSADRYAVMHNQDTVDTARHLVEAAPERAETIANSDAVGAVANQVRAQLMAEYSRAADAAKATGNQAEYEANINKAISLAEDTALKVRDQAQGLQVMSTIDKLSPEGVLTYAQQVIDQANKIDPKLNIKLPTNVAGDLLDKVKALEGMAEGPEKIAARNEILKLISEQVPSSMRDKVITFWKAGLVSSPTTQFAKILGDTTNLVLSNVADATSTVIDRIAYLGNKLTDIAGLTDNTAKITKSWSPSSLIAQWDGIVSGAKSGYNVLKTGAANGFYEELDQTLNGAGIKSVKETSYGNSLGGKILNYYTRAAFRGLKAATAVFKEAGLRASLYEQARVIATNEGLAGEEFTARVKDLFSAPTDEMAYNAINQADYRTFINDNAFSDMATAAKNAVKNPIYRGATEVILPFTKVPSNVANFFVDFSPAGVVKTLIEAIPAEGRNQQAIVEGLGKAITGTGIFGLGLMLASKDLITGSLPQDPKQQADFYAAGKEPDSIHIGGDWYQLAKLPGIGPLLSAAADFHTSYAQDHSLSSASLSAGAGALKTIADQPFLQGLSGALAAIQTPNLASTTLDSTVGSLVPNIVAKATRIFDPALRTPDKTLPLPQQFLQALEKNIPGLSKNVTPKRDVFGNLVTNPGGRLAIIDPFAHTKAQNQPILDEAQNVGVGIGLPPQIISGVKLTAKEYNYYQFVHGHIMQQALDQLINDPDYQGATDADKQKAFKDTISEVTTATENQVFPTIMNLRYGLPDDTDPTTLREVLVQLNKQQAFKKLTPAQQKKAVQYYMQQSTGQ